MRPQFHHVDAITHVEKASRERETDETRPPQQARAVTQTYKDTRDAEDPRALREKSLLQMAQEEPWTKMTYLDEDVRESPLHACGVVTDSTTGGGIVRRLSREAFRATSRDFG